MTTNGFFSGLCGRAAAMVFALSIALSITLPVAAGSLTPPGTPGPTMATLDEIKTAVDDNGVAVGEVDTKVVSVDTKVTGLQSSVSSVSSKVDDVGADVADLQGTSSASMLPVPEPSQMFETYAIIEGANQGFISDQASSEDSLGEMGAPGPNEDKITVLNFENTILKRLSSNGTPTTGMSFEFSKILKYVDRSSPLLLSALRNNETLQITVEHHRNNVMFGGSDLYYTHTYSNCKIAAIRHVGPNLEEIEFFFLSLTAEHQIEGTVSTAP